MNTAIEFLKLAVSILVFLALIPALSISGRIILRNPFRADRPTRLFLWLVLGGFFLIPLADLISYLGNLLMLAIPSDQNTAPVVLFLGTTSWLFYTILFTLVGIITYALGIYYGRRIIDERRLPVIKDLVLTGLEKNLVVLGLAGLLHSMVTGILLRFFSIRIPLSSGPLSQGFAGALIGLIGAFSILAIVIFLMNEKLKSQS